VLGAISRGQEELQQVEGACGVSPRTLLHLLVCGEDIETDRWKAVPYTDRAVSYCAEEAVRRAAAVPADDAARAQRGDEHMNDTSASGVITITTGLRPPGTVRRCHESGRMAHAIKEASIIDLTHGS